MFGFEITKEHQWLQQMVGDWTFEAEMTGPPDEPPLKTKGKEKVRMLGENWLVAEGEGEIPCDELETRPTGYTCLTIGYSPEKQAMIGTWIGSMMNHMWVYEGSLDLEKGLLILNTSGPKCDGSEGKAQYRESLQLVSPDERLFSSAMQGDDGEWITFMKAVYKRVA
ncbi:DUF1579 domain-containing protein [Blastopirellula sp. JC732]|uniref:DUF1579 domain-containing protein n=1 Tax=Blastopirellula sediminis TaxID=2894196 RepID=A0A9X1MTL4_9BACT|nr:DUF1579 domain-containing protein [Blastopirellula sediminis]MCC9604536.1 DUF1579 domain-containing protein [Blastopirellula sediminis]MCC9632165.1 DUF1579 domain-containing protein [Blastopirellula sediminis]